MFLVRKLQPLTSPLVCPFAPPCQELCWAHLPRKHMLPLLQLLPQHPQTSPLPWSCEPTLCQEP